MKKLALIATVVFALVSLTGCAPKFQQIPVFLDYQAIGQGVLLTESNSVSFDYISIGSIVVTEAAGQSDKKNKSIKQPEDIYGSDGYKTGSIREASVVSALYRAVDEAKARGGDAIINLRTDQEMKNGICQTAIVKGMIVKRK